MPKRIPLKTVGLLLSMVLTSTCYRSYSARDRGNSDIPINDSGTFDPPGMSTDSGSVDSIIKVSTGGVGADDDDTGVVDIDDAGDCIADCDSKECGSDGCDGTCPPGCPENHICDPQTGLCECVPNCDAKECGSDGCGGTCPPGCPQDYACSQQTGLCDCIPDCESRECGSDGCGGTCLPGCAEDENCNEQTGLCECAPDCDSKECGPDGCGGTCSPGCPETHTCNQQIGECECIPNCLNRECGSDGCGGLCAPGCTEQVGCSPMGKCIEFIPGPSCDGLIDECMDGEVSVSCCDAKLIVGGTFPMGQGEIGSTDYFEISTRYLAERPEHDTTVADFYLDTFEVTVGRFRQFVAAYDAGWRPDPGDGEHPYIYESGWNESWNRQLESDADALIQSMSCSSRYATWSDEPTRNQRLPINCVNWYHSFAFCIWDGGRLPTEAEWEYATAGGAENRLYEWGSAIPDATRAVYYCLAHEGGTCVFKDILDVGSRPLGRSRWGNYDLSGSMWEWTLDSYDGDWYSLHEDECVNCANLQEYLPKVPRGGSFLSDPRYLRAAYRTSGIPEMPYYDIGIRCARTPVDF